MNAPRRFRFALLSALVALAANAPLRAQDGPPAEAVSASAFSESERATLQTLDAAIARFDALLATVKDVHEKAAVKSFLDAQKDRRHQLRPGFDVGIFDNLRLDVEIEYQRLVAWLAPMKPTRANRRDITIPLPPVASATGAVTVNQLSPAEKQAGWQLLFDGKTLQGWRGYGRKDLPQLPFGWEIKDGALHAKPADKTKNLKFSDFRQGELITDRKYNDYELSWDWRVAKKSNSGLKYLVIEERPNAPGPEFQMADDLSSTNASPDRWLHATAGFYAIIEPAKDIPLRAAGEWNTSRIVVRGNHLEHWHNGKLVMSCELGGPQVMAGVAKSKFKDEPGFGRKVAGHIMLTYHGDEAWIRNMKIREIRDGS